MVHKNLMLKKSTKLGIALDILFPVLVGFYFYYFAKTFEVLT